MLSEWIRKARITGHAAITVHFINKSFKAVDALNALILIIDQEIMDDLKELKKIELEEDTLKDLDTTRKWSMFIAILGFIAIGIMLLIGLIAGVFLSVTKTQEINLGAGESILIFGLLLLFGVIYFFPIMYLYRFSKHAGNAVRALDKEQMQKAFRYLRKYYVFIGITIIIVLVIYVIALIASGASLALLKDLGTGI